MICLDFRILLHFQLNKLRKNPNSQYERSLCSMLIWVHAHLRIGRHHQIGHLSFLLFLNYLNELLEFIMRQVRQLHIQRISLNGHTFNARTVSVLGIFRSGELCFDSFGNRIKFLLISYQAQFFLIKGFNLFESLKLGHDLLKMASTLSRCSCDKKLAESFENSGGSKYSLFYFLFSLELKIFV